MIPRPARAFKKAASPLTDSGENKNRSIPGMKEKVFLPAPGSPKDGSVESFKIPIGVIGGRTLNIPPGPSVEPLFDCTV